MKETFKQYIDFRNEVDLLSEKLSKTHSKHMKCKAGCDMCCMDYSVFPIEFYFILNELKKNQLPPKFNNNASAEDCIFLNKHRCSIYNSRPIICRTHGLPLLYMNDSGDWELSACELNFTEFDMANFDEKNTFPQDTYNSKLFLLNKAFIDEFKEKRYSEFELIPIRKLAEYI